MLKHCWTSEPLDSGQSVKESFKLLYFDISSSAVDPCDSFVLCRQYGNAKCSHAG